MTKQDTITALEASRREFLDAIDGLSPEQVLAPRTIGEWSVRDVLQHLSLWEAELVRLMLHVHQGRRPIGPAFTGARPDYDAINLEWHAQTVHRPLERVLDDFHGVRRQTVRWIGEFSDEDLARVRPEAWLRQRSLAEWILSYAIEHEAEHTRAIKEWRAARP
jgi:hypothetical protein